MGNKSNSKDVAPVSVATDFPTTHKETVAQRSVPLQERNSKKRKPDVLEVTSEAAKTQRSTCGAEKPAHTCKPPKPGWKKTSERVATDLPSTQKETVVQR